MSRNATRRLSRALIVGLVATLALGLVFWLGQLAGSSREKKAEANRTAKAPSTQPIRVAIGEAAPRPAPSKPAESPAQPVATPTITTPSPAPPSAPPVLAAVSQVSLGPAAKPVESAQVASLTTAAPAKPGVPGSLIAEARALSDSGKMIQARNMLNASLTDPKTTALEKSAAKAMLNQVNTSVVFSTDRFPEDQFIGTFDVPQRAVLSKIADRFEVTPELLLRVNNLGSANKLQADRPIKVIKGPFHAIVYKGVFRIEMWQGEPNGKGSMYVTSFPVGLGKDDSTPTGVWAIKNKLTNPAYYSPRGQGVIAADDPKNPLGEYWIGLTGADGQAVGKQSYGIHGTIDPDSVGKQSSMGCIRLRNEDIAQVYQMLTRDKSLVTVAE